MTDTHIVSRRRTTCRMRDNLYVHLLSFKLPLSLPHCSLRSLTLARPLSQLCNLSKSSETNGIAKFLISSTCQLVERLARVQHTHTRADIVSTLSYSIAKSGLRTYLFKLFRILIQQLTQSLQKLPLYKVEEWPQIP